MDKAPISFVAPDPDAVLRYQLERMITSLFKGYLVMLEDLGDSHDEAMDKLRAALPADLKGYVDLADYLTEERGVSLRKKVLDSGNDTKREMNKLLDQFTVQLNR